MISATTPRHSLKNKVVQPMLAVGFVIAALALMGIYATTESSLLNRLRIRSEIIAHSVNYAAENISAPADLHRFVTAIGAGRDVTLIVVTGGTPPRVLAATHAAWINEPVSSLPDLSVAGPVREAITSRSQVSTLKAQEKEFELCSPIVLSRTDIAPRAVSEGAVLVRLDTSPTYGEISRTSSRFAAAFLAILGGLTLLGYYLLNRYVLHPVASLASLIDARGGDDEGFTKLAASGDEIGALAETLRTSLRRTDSAVRELKQKQAELQVLFDLVPAMIWFKDTKNGFLRVNRRVTEITGLPVEEIEGRTAEQLFPREAAAYYADDLEVIRSGRPKMGILEKLAGADGQDRWVQTDKVPCHDQDGNVIGLVAMVHDITERKQIESALIESEDRFRGIFENAAIGIGQLSIDGRFETANDMLCEIMGYTREDLLTLTFSDLTLPEDMEASMAAYKRMIGGTLDTYTVEKRYLRKDGVTVWVNLVSNVVRKATGEALCLISVFEDITQRKRAEKELSDSRANMAVAQSIAHFGSWELDLTDPTNVDSQELIWSDEMYRIAGFEPGSVKVTNDFFFSLVPEPEHASIRKAVATAIAQRQEYSIIHSLIRPDGEERYVHEIAQLVFDEETGQLLKMIGTAHDITEKRYSELEVALKEQRYRTLVEATTAIVWDMPASGDFETEQPSWSSFTGQTYDQYRKSGWLDAIHPDDQKETARIWSAAVKNRSIYAVEQRVMSRDGTYRHMSVRAVPILDPAGDIIQWIGIHTDITERKQSEETLRLLSSAVQQSRESILITDATLDLPGPRILFVNPAFTQMTGYTSEEVMDKTPRILQGPRTDRAVLDRLRKNLTDGEVFVGETVNYRKDGSEFNLEWQGAPIRNTRGEITHFVAIQRDITERLRNQRLSLRSQRLESLGTLAGGVAHDLNNALAPILLSVGLLRTKYPGESNVVDMLETSARRGANMVRQLLSFAKGADGDRASVHLTHLIHELESMMKGSFPKNIHLAVHCDASLPSVLGDATQLHQVLLNLCVNARDAMLLGGTLTLEAHPKHVDVTYAAQIHDGRPGNFVVLSVRDTGTGMSREIMDRIFDPFFSTKGPEKGTGLGLSTVSGIVKGHGGFLHVSSQPGHGSTFSVYLPAELSSSSPERPPEQKGNFRGLGETILVVDDDEPIRKMSCAVLERLNFTPVTAEDGIDGLALVAQQGAGLYAIITDMHMPNMDGLAFAVSVRRMLPNIPIVIASGRMEDSVSEKLKALGLTMRLDKPFTELQLSEALKSLLAPGT